ncbi:MAG: hypothetical protein WCD44_01825 [Candidatus Babeliales bacterium]|jgi:hypothetical protein
MRNFSYFLLLFFCISVNKINSMDLDEISKKNPLKSVSKYNLECPSCEQILFNATYSAKNEFAELHAESCGICRKDILTQSQACIKNFYIHCPTVNCNAMISSHTEKGIRSNLKNHLLRTQKHANDFDGFQFCPDEFANYIENNIKKNCP